MSALLKTSVSSHAGQFTCVGRGKNKDTSKIVTFRHVGNPPNPEAETIVPDVPSLRSFYSVFEQLLLYFDELSGEAAYLIASPFLWSQLDTNFRLSIDHLSEAELASSAPSWVSDRNYITIGEVSQSGNYLLVPLTGADAGKVFEFEHDGFEFLERAANLSEFVIKSLDIDSRQLTSIASHLTFSSDNYRTQWWIVELRDNRGNAVRTQA